MKNLLTLFLLLITIISCQQESIKEPAKILVDYKTVGDFYNNGLDYILNELKTSAALGKLTKQRALEINQEAGVKYLNQICNQPWCKY